MATTWTEGASEARTLDCHIRSTDNYLQNSIVHHYSGQYSINVNGELADEPARTVCDKPADRRSDLHSICTHWKHLLRHIDDLDRTGSKFDDRDWKNGGPIENHLASLSG